MNEVPTFQQKIYEMLMESQYWPPEQMREYQRSQLTQLLRHAKATVPFYKTRLDVVIDRNGKLDWSRWSEIPILKRAEVAANFDSLQSTKLPPGHLATSLFSTSGSTGLPIKVRFNNIMGMSCVANDWRSHRWWGLDWAHSLVFWQGSLKDGWEEKATTSRGPWGYPGVDSTKLGKSYVFERNAPIETLIGHLRETQAKYLYAQANYPSVVANEMLKIGRSCKLDTVMSFGVTIEPEYHEVVASAYGAKLRCMYSSKEGGRIAYSCPITNHYHVCSETVLVEILDEKDRACPPGQMGRIIVTPFLGTAQPFIRYDQGDTGTWGDVCSCSIKLPVISRIGGRTYDSFKRLNGEIYAPTVPDSLRTILGAEFWQFAQTKKNEIVVRYKPLSVRNLQKEEAFIHELRNALKEPYNIKYEIVTNLPLTSAGKFIKYRNELKT